MPFREKFLFVTCENKHNLRLGQHFSENIQTRLMEIPGFFINEVNNPFLSFANEIFVDFV